MVGITFFKVGHIIFRGRAMNTKVEQQKTVSPITNDNQLLPALTFFDEPFLKQNNTSKEFFDYLTWVDAHANPPQSYRDHPISSETQLNQFKKTFEKYVGISLGAYLRIKRAYFLLNSKDDTASVSCEFGYVHTPIGMMLAIFSLNKNNHQLCLLEFIERKMLPTELTQIQQAKSCQFVFKPTPSNSPLKKERTAFDELQTQLDEYFAGKRQHFDIALDTVGTQFQQDVWQTLQSIGYGKTISYQDEAEQMGKPTAMRAVANANGKNKISIVIPCHRVIRKSGDLGGYGGGLWRKRFLLALERGR